MGRTAEELSRQHPFDLEIVERVLNHIIELEQIPTKKEYSRLSGRDLNKDHGRWIPPSPRSSSEITAANNIINAMRKKFKNPKIRDRFKSAFAYHLTHTVHSKNYVSFTRISDLRSFLWLFGSKVKPELWRAEVIYSQRQDEERMRAYWGRSDLHIQYHNKPTKRRVKNTEGSLRLILELDHKDKRVSEKLKARGDASMILRYIMPMVAMLVLSGDEIKQLHSDGASSQAGH